MPRRRFSREEKVAAVKRMLAGEDPLALSRELNVPRQMFYQWRARFLSGGTTALRNPAGRASLWMSSSSRHRNDWSWCPGRTGQDANNPRKETTIQRRIFLIGTAALLILGVPATPAGTIKATLYKDPACGCCGAYADYLRNEGFTIEVVATAEFADIGRKAGVPESFEGCHTLFIGDYVVSGHIPAETVRKLLDERPAIAGITLAGMPAGSPGMGGDKTEPFEIYAFSKDGKQPALYATL